MATLFGALTKPHLLRREVIDRIRQAQFEPAVYRHQHVPVYLIGAVVFAVRDGKPHLQIFLNQNQSDLMSGKNFIAPQFAFVPGNTKFRGIYYPPESPGHEGVVALALDVDVDAKGAVAGVKVDYEYPPGFNFGKWAADPMRDALFIPAFRDGQANCVSLQLANHLPRNRMEDEDGLAVYPATLARFAQFAFANLGASVT